MKMRISLVETGVVLFVFLLAGASAGARGYDNKDFSLRLPSALTRFSPFPDVGGVSGSSAASKWASSVNPASTDWVPIEARLHLAPSSAYSLIDFAAGTRLNVLEESIVWNAGRTGSFQPAFVQARSNTRPTLQGLDFEYELNYYQFKWGKRFANVAFGAAVNISTSQTEFSYGGSSLAKADGESYGLRTGVLYEPAKKWLMGLVLEYTAMPATTKIPTGLGILEVKDTTDQYLLRPGVSYEYAKDSTAYLDYQLAYFTNDTGKLQTQFFMAGLDHRIVDWLFVRAGAGVDIHGNLTGSVGVGFYPKKNLLFDIAYQRNMFPELEPDFGQSNTFSFGITLTF